MNNQVVAIVSSNQSQLQHQLVSIALAGLSGRGREQYRRYLDRFFRWCTDNHRGIDGVSVQSFLRTLTASQQVPFIAALKRLTAAAVTHGADIPNHTLDAIAGAKPVDKQPKGRRVGTWLSQTQLQGWLNRINDHRTTSPLWLRNGALMAMLVGCGLRREEAVRLTESNLRQVEGRWAFEVIGKGNKYRGVAIPDWAFAWIRDWIKCLPGDRKSREGCPILRRVHGQGWTGTRAVGAGVLTGEAVRLILLSILEDVPIQGEDGEPVRLRPHDLRRTWAVLGLRNGASLDMVRNGLGHSDLATTQKYLQGADEMRPGMAVGDLVVNSPMLTDSWWEKIRKNPVEWAKWKIVLAEEEGETPDDKR